MQEVERPVALADVHPRDEAFEGLGVGEGLAEVDVRIEVGRIGGGVGRSPRRATPTPARTSGVSCVAQDGRGIVEDAAQPCNGPPGRADRGRAQPGDRLLGAHVRRRRAM
jgi:hypothetical protein